MNKIIIIYVRVLNIIHLCITNLPTQILIYFLYSFNRNSVYACVCACACVYVCVCVCVRARVCVHALAVIYKKAYHMNS